MKRRPGRKALTPETRIAKWVADGKLTLPPVGCWVWTGSTTDGGYGQIGMSGKAIGRPELATVHYVLHRWMYEVHRGPIPEGLDLDHLCRVRACCNPDHLEPVTRSVNLERAEGIGIQWSSRTECSSGHAYTPENTGRATDGSRTCRTCRREYARRAQARKREVTA